MTEKEMLNYAIESGIIDIGTIQKKIEMNERKKFIEKHEYRIWQGTNGKWYTYVPDDTKKVGRRMIKKAQKNHYLIISLISIRNARMTHILKMYSTSGQKRSLSMGRF